MDRDISALRRRLGYLDKTVRKKDEAGGQPDKNGFLDSGGWSRVGDYTFVRTRWIDNPLGSQNLSEHLVPDGFGTGDLVFFDTETTGLSGGAGNFIFLFGLARPRAEGEFIECEQIFLSDFPGEREFLEAVWQRITGKKLFVSYNGKSFDSHVLKTRFILNNLDCGLERQIDLLYWSRRLWKRLLDNCSLGNIEREVLGIHRCDDVSGAEVPGIYFRYLRTGEEGLLPAVFQHNLQDIISLVSLFVLLNRILNGPDSGRLKRRGDFTGVGEKKSLEAVNLDQASLGKSLVERGDPRGLEILKESFSGGDQWSGRSLSLFYKREDRWAEAAEIWERMALRGKSIFATLELAKYCEHRKKSPREALHWTRKILSWDFPVDVHLRREIFKRLKRLERKSLKQK